MSKDSDLQEMIDHFQITKVLTEYCHGCDRADQVHMASVYLDDSWDDHGDKKMPGKEFAVDTTAHLLETLNMCNHNLGQSLIKVNGDEAGAETYFIANLRAAAPDGGEVLNQIGGRYCDTLRRENGQWKIKKRICVRDWSITLPITEDFLKNSAFVRGQMSGDDPSYAALGIKHSGLPRVDAARRAAR